MPTPELSHRLQKAVLWQKTGIDRYGQPTVGAPVEIFVRWNDVRREVLDKEGNTIALDATAVVAQTIEVGSRMWLGALANWVGTGSVGNEDDVCYVKTYNETPDLKNRIAMRTVGLMRYKDNPNA